MPAGAINIPPITVKIFILSTKKALTFECGELLRRLMWFWKASDNVVTLNCDFLPGGRF